mmetsp:Transcript_41161/g.63424  ORF Transcript_41161/g.63424 Transcript_41161/m.63424 type:complete len:111 (-) Transcript_41161:182-514(-)
MKRSKVWCPDVYVDKSSVCPEGMEFDGAYAGKDFKKGELIERGIMRILPEGFDGNKYGYCFTWSEKKPNTTWAMGSGCATFYNTSKDPNVKMTRDFENKTFEFYAHKDIK